VPPGVTWEWEGDGGKWSQFSADHSRLLSEALINGDSDVSVQVAQSVKMKIRFDSMTQTNVGTGWQRNVHCASSSQSGSPDTQTVWEWENDRGVWAWFPPAHQRLLHACKACQVDTVSVETRAGKQSRVDLGSMTHEMGRGKKFGVRCSSLAGQWTMCILLYTVYTTNIYSIILQILPPHFCFLSVAIITHLLL
jgi:hypothetical protein